MAIKLSKAEANERSAHEARLTAARDRLVSGVEWYNRAVAEAAEKFASYVEAYNEALGEARGWLEDIASQAESDIGEKSEKWQEGDAGQSATAFMDAYRDASEELLDYEFEAPDPLEEPIELASLEELPSEPE